MVKFCLEDATSENVESEFISCRCLHTLWIKKLVCSMKSNRDEVEKEGKWGEEGRDRGRQGGSVESQRDTGRSVNNMPGSRPPGSGTFGPVGTPCILLGLHSFELGFYLLQQKAS